MAQHAIYYIRFLKPPPSRMHIGQPFQIVWTVANDLAESTYYDPLTIVCRLHSAPSTVVLRAGPNSNNNKKGKAKPSAAAISIDDCTLELEYDPFKGGGVVSTFLVLEGPKTTNKETMMQLSLSLDRGTQSSHPIWVDTFRAFENGPWIVPVWSLSFHLLGGGGAGKQGTAASPPAAAAATDQFDRHLKVDNSLSLTIRENALQSIAGHIWDCGLLLCEFLSTWQPGRTFDTILELGSGTGVAGIYASHALDTKRVYLTDLPDVVPLCHQNAELQPVKQKKLLRVQALEWGKQQQQPGSVIPHVDLAILTDVLYNQSSHDVLIDTLSQLFARNPDMLVLLTYKQRHPDERIFFSKIQEWQSEKIQLEHCELYFIKHGR